MFRLQFKNRSEIAPLSSLPRVTNLEAVPVALSDAEKEAIAHRVEDYLDQVLAPLTDSLPYMRRRELRRELYQHLDAMIRAYQEIGETSEAACDKAFFQFGSPAEVAASIRSTSVDHNRWKRIQTWWRTPRMSAMGAVSVLPALLVAGMALTGYLKTSRLSIPSDSTTPKIHQAQIAFTNGHFHHSGVLNPPCADCHRSMPIAVPPVVEFHWFTTQQRIAPER